MSGVWDFIWPRKASNDLETGNIVVRNGTKTPVFRITDISPGGMFISIEEIGNSSNISIKQRSDFRKLHGG
jgi:hypothetical protein